MPRDERELAYHWRVEVSKAYRILDRLWQGPTPNWNGHYTSRDIRQAAHLCQQAMIALGSDPDLIEEYAQELFAGEHKGEDWDTAAWNLHSMYRERARHDLQGMAPSRVKAENVLIQAESAEAAMDKLKRDDPEYASGTVRELIEVYFRSYGVNVQASVTRKGMYQYVVHVAPVRAQQHEQQEELHEHEQCKSVLDHPDIEVEE